jgi:CHAT domain-containing protein/Tfp pilus assembly protein PilF
MPQIRKGLVCVVVLLAGFAAAFVSLQPPQSPPAEVETLPAERTAPAALEEPSPRVSFPAPTSERVERLLEVGTVHVYPLTVKSGYLLELIVEQDGVDLQVSVRDSDKILFTVDGDNYRDGPERLLLAAKETAPYSVEVSGRSLGEAGRYAIQIMAERLATERDWMAAEAEKLFHQAKEGTSGGDPRLSEEKLMEAIDLWEKARNAERQAEAFQLLGNIYREQSEWQKSIEPLRRARAVFRRLGRLEDEGLIANDIGVVYEKLSNLDLARKSYQEALTLGKRSGDSEIQAAAFYNLGNLARRRSRSGEALENLERARVIWRRAGSAQEIDALLAIGGIFAEAGAVERALPRLQQARALAIAKEDLNRQAAALTQMGHALWREEPEQARYLYERALEIQRQLGGTGSLGSTLNGIGLLHVSQKRYQEALSPLQQALRIYKQRNSPLDQARTLTNLGFALSGLGREADARMAYETAIAFGGQDSLTEAAARAGWARLEEQLGNPIEARNQAEAAVQRVESMRTTTRSDLRISLLANRQGIYGDLIDILMWQHELRPSAKLSARAFDISERARTRGLLDHISRLERSTDFSLPQRMLERHQSEIDPDTLLLEYHLGRKASYLWLVDRSYLHVLRLPPRETIETLVDDARRLLSAKGRDLRAAYRAASALSHALLKPAEPWLGRKRLVISAPDLLQSIPFGVLPDPGAAKASTEWMGWPDPLILNHEIVKIPSLAVLVALREREARRLPPPNLLALLYDPVFEATDERFGKDVVPATRDRAQEDLFDPFVRLRHADDEAEAILRETGRHGVLTAFGFAANRDFVLRGNLRGSRNIHFTTHGWLQTKDADLSALVLSQFDRRGRPIDGFLRASDIVRLDVPADLVVLSACETGLGERIPGEGLVGLPQAFMAAGATRVLVSLWPVEDLASSILMGRFYQEYLAKGRSPAAALREAQKAMWQSDRNAPFYWGAFELQGDWRLASSPR